MSEIIKPPKAWSMLADLSDVDLKSKLGKSRLISIKSYVRNGKRLYCGIAVQDAISALSWTANMTPANLRQSVQAASGRLISLDAFWDANANELRCAGVWIKNAEGWKWNFDVDLSPSAITSALNKDKAKLTCLRVYQRPGGSDQKPPMASVEKYCAIWIQDDGHPWDWDPDIAVPALGLRLDDDGGRLVSIDDHGPDTWSPTAEKVAAVWWKNDSGAVWFWNIGLDAAALQKEFPKFCSYGLDVVPAGPVQFASIMCQFPKQPDVSEANLISFSGSGAGTFRDDLWQNIDWQFQQQNLTATAVTYTSAVMFSAAEGGWCWWSGNFKAGQTIMGLPFTIAANGGNSASGTWGVSNAPKVGVFCLRADDGGGKQQELLAQARITQNGFSTPANLPIAWPVFLGLQLPVEVVKLTNGKHWVTVAAQICNGTNLDLTVTNAYVRLRDQSNVLHEAYFTDKLTIDQDASGSFLNAPVVGAVVASPVPLPKFYDGFEVPAGFTSGKLKVLANVKFSGPLACYGDTREVTVVAAPVTALTRLPYDKPVVTGGSNGPYRWHWGNGVGGTSFNAHSYPEHRYSYDLGVFDAQNKTLKPGGDPLQNADYYCWQQSILAMDPGVVQFVDDSHPDNVGNQGNVNSNLANVVVIFNNDKNLYQFYAHLSQGSAIDKNGKKLKKGDLVQAGDLIGKVGNAGDSSEPHLHVGISRRDAEGFLRSLPMSFNKIKDGAGNVVSGVPVDGEFYAS
jgi:hypothetical protein